MVTLFFESCSHELVFCVMIFGVGIAAAPASRRVIFRSSEFLLAQIQGEL
jgi:hypothetical protein